MSKNRFVRAGLLAVLVSGLGACDRTQPIRLEGATQGTTYHVTIATCIPQRDSTEWQRRVEARLAEIDKSLSNYREDSQLSRFNRAPVGIWFPLDRDLYAVLLASQRVSADSIGAFDITIAPLVELWGFGPHAKAEAIPADAAIAMARAQVDYRQLQIDTATPRALKRAPLAIDVNGIAQGYTVDAIADLLAASGCTDYLVEIGGELRLAGLNAERKPWRIGIETPGDGITPVQQAIVASGIGVTTAGDYHDYFEKDDVRYSHTIDPRSGRPIAHKLASVTVVAASATDADGYDTVLEVLGPDAGLAFAQAHDIAAYFIVRDGGAFKTFHTHAMEKYLPRMR